MLRKHWNWIVFPQWSNPLTPTCTSLAASWGCISTFALGEVLWEGKTHSVNFRIYEAAWSKFGVLSIVTSQLYVSGLICLCLLYKWIIRRCFFKTAVKLDKYLGSTTLFYKIKAKSPLFLSKDCSRRTSGHIILSLPGCFFQATLAALHSAGTRHSLR